MKRNVFFTADQHLGHDKIRLYCKRPFSTKEEMNQVIISNWNNVVGNNDTVYVLGDFAFGNAEQIEGYVQQLKGNIVFICGNHDKSLFAWAKSKGKQVFQNYMAKAEGEEFFLSHYAHRVWNKSHYGVIHLYGHSHGGLPDLDLSMDVGVDVNNFTPVAASEIIKKMLTIREQLLKEGKIFKSRKED